jgi:hypothetical protein
VGFPLFFHFISLFLRDSPVYILSFTEAPPTSKREEEREEKMMLMNIGNRTTCATPFPSYHPSSFFLLHRPPLPKHGPPDPLLREDKRKRRKENRGM